MNPSTLIDMAVHGLKELLRRGRPPLEPGSEAPLFEARAHDGRTIRLADLRGRKVLLWFYPKAATPG